MRVRGLLPQRPGFFRRAGKRPALRAAIRALGPEDQQIVLLAVVGGYSGKEIAALLHKPEGTLRSRLHRSLKKLQKLLPEEATHP